MKVPALEACPCCGGSAYSGSNYFDSYDRVRYYVACGRCEMRGPSLSKCADPGAPGVASHATAACLWNKLAARVKAPQAGRPIVLHGRAS